MATRQIEMFWRCTSCDHRNLGRFKTCRGCANPKDGSESYEMPDDPASAPSVTDEALLRMATAGPDWRCAYCGSDQRRYDDGCAHCGADAVSAATDATDRNADADSSSDASYEDVGLMKRPGGGWVGCLVLLVLLVIVVGIAGSSGDDGPKTFEARVTAVSWQRQIVVERYAQRPHEGFRSEIPTGASNVKSIGKRVSGHDSVPDGFRTERYTVDVPDGYRTETYTDRERCGETCSTTPRRCSEKCTSNRNGFATCRETCTGGERSCETKYCRVTKTRREPKTRTETRTRQVREYRSVPRYAEAFRWRAWGWAHERTLQAARDDGDPQWPDTRLKQGLARGEDERETRTESYRVTLTLDEDGRTVTWSLTSEDAFRRFAPASTHQVRIEKGKYSVDGTLIVPR